MLVNGDNITDSNRDAYGLRLPRRFSIVNSDSNSFAIAFTNTLGVCRFVAVALSL